MPCIAEIREIDDCIWVRVDLADNPSGISLYTPEEMKDLRINILSEAAWVAAKMNALDVRDAINDLK